TVCAPPVVFAASESVVGALGALERQGLAAHRKSDSEDPLNLRFRVVLEARLAPIEHLEEELAGELLDAKRQSVVGVVAPVENEAGERPPSREALREELVKRRGRESPAS